MQNTHIMAALRERPRFALWNSRSISSRRAFPPGGRSGSRDALSTAAGHRAGWNRRPKLQVHAVQPSRKTPRPGAALENFTSHRCILNTQYGMLHTANPATYGCDMSQPVNFASPAMANPELDALSAATSKPKGGSRQHRLRLYAARMGLGATILVLWQVSADRGWVDRLFTSSPKDVSAFLSRSVQDGSIWAPTLYTMTEAVLAFVIGGIMGIILGTLLATMKWLDDITRPFITALNSLPRIALAPLFTLWFGIGMTSKVYLGVSLAAIIVLVSTQQAMISVESELIRSSRALGATRLHQYRHVLIPASIPGILGGLRLGMVYSLLGVVSGEMIAAREGIGQRIVTFSNLYQMDGVLGLLLVLAALSLLINETMLWIENSLSSWRHY